MLVSFNTRRTATALTFKGSLSFGWQVGADGLGWVVLGRLLLDGKLEGMDVGSSEAFNFALRRSSWSIHSVEGWIEVLGLMLTLGWTDGCITGLELGKDEGWLDGLLDVEGLSLGYMIVLWMIKVQTKWLWANKRSIINTDRTDETETLDKRTNHLLCPLHNRHVSHPLSRLNLVYQVWWLVFVFYDFWWLCFVCLSCCLDY